MIYARLIGDHLPGMGSARPVIAAPDRTFVLSGLFGERTLDVLNVPEGWYVKSIHYGGRDITDEPTVFGSNRDSPVLDIVLSNRGAVVSGRAVDDRGQPVPGAIALMFTVDQTHWNWSEPTRARVKADGTFTLGPRRPGSYFVVALDSPAELADGGNPELFGRLAKIAERVTLGDDEARTLDLQVVAMPAASSRR
jgi:hypothetical protein